MHQGKVRDIYEIDAERMLIVTTDRLSAFDVIMNEPIPEKGQVLTAWQISGLIRFESIIPNHLTHDEVRHPLLSKMRHSVVIKNRAVVVKKLTPIPVEANCSRVCRWEVAGKSTRGINLFVGLHLPG